MTYVNGGDGRVSNHISDVVYLPSRSRRRGGRQHHFAGHAANSPRPPAGIVTGSDLTSTRFSRKRKTIFLPKQNSPLLSPPTIRGEIRLELVFSLANILGSSIIKEKEKLRKMTRIGDGV